MSPTKIPILTLSILAVGAIAARQAVGYNGQVAAAGQPIFGIASTDAPIGDQVAADVLGTSIAIAGAPVQFGQPLEVGAQGRLVPHDEGTPVARALSEGGAEAAIEVLLIPA